MPKYTIDPRLMLTENEFNRGRALTGTNAIEGGLASKILRGKDWKSRLASALFSSGLQTYEEGGQRGFQLDVEGKPSTLNPYEMLTNPKYAEQLKEMKETAAPITALSLLGFAGGSAYRSIFDDKKQNRNQNPPSQKENPQGDVYTGENGKAEDKYWERNPNMNVSFDGAQPDLMNALDMLAKYYYENTGKKLVVNAGTNGKHADGEHSHKAGWKVDVVDAGGSDVSMAEDGPLFTANYGKGKFLDQFIKYGRNLGLGMNLESLGTGNVHLDIALDGDQWDGNGENAGGFNPSGSENLPPKKSAQKRGATIEHFMRAISGQESGDNYDALNSDSGAAGKFQIMPENWASWAEDAGLSPDAPMTPENQDLVAKNKMLEYYKKFGNWRDVAIAWYGGEGAVNYSDEAKNRPQGNYPSINEYADSVMARLEKIAGTQEGETPSSATENSNFETENELPPIERDESLDKIISDLLNQKSEPLFKLDAEDELTKNIFKNFAEDKKINATGEELAAHSDFFQKVFDKDGNFKDTKENREIVKKNFGDELQNFGQNELNKKISDYKNFLQTRENPLAEEVSKLTSHLQELTQNYNQQRTSGNPNANILSQLQENIFKTSEELTQKQNQLSQIQNVLNPAENVQPAENIFQPAEIQAPAKITGFTLNQGAKEKGYDKILKSVLENNSEPQFSPTDKNFRNIVAQFALEKRKDENLKKFFKGMFKRNGKKLQFKNSADNREKLIYQFGDELQNFGQAELDRRVADFNQRYTSQTQPSEQIPNPPAENVQPQEISQPAEIQNSVQPNQDFSQIQNQTRQVLNDYWASQNQSQTPSNIEDYAPEVLPAPKFDGTLENVQPQEISQQEIQPPTLQTHQDELTALKKNLSAEKKKLSNEIGTGNIETARSLKNNIANLNQQIADKTAEIEEFKKSPAHIQTLNDELENLKERQAILNELLNSGVQDKNLSKQRDDLTKNILAREKELQQLQQTPMFEENLPIKKVGANYEVRGGKNPAPSIQIAENFGGKYDARNNNFIFDNQESARNFLAQRTQNDDAPSGEYQNGIYGAETTVETSSEKEISVRYKIVPNHSLNISHKITGGNISENKFYPQELQPKKRDSQTLQAQVFSMVGNLKPHKVAESNYLNEGAPITREDGVVLNGNGRAMAIEESYDENKAANYKKYLLDNAEKFGFTAEEISQFENPILVREVAEEIDAETLSEITGSNEGGANLNPSEQAKSDANFINLFDFDDYNENSGGDLTAKSNRNFINTILNRVAKTPKQQNSYRTSDGNLNDEGIKRVQNAIFALAYGNENFLKRMELSVDDDIKNISKAAQSAAVDFAKLKLKEQAGYAEEYKIGEVVADAAETYSEIKRDENFSSVQNFINQNSNALFDPKQNAIFDLLEVFDANKKNSARIAEFLKEIARAADKKPNPDQTNLNFGGDVEEYRKARVDEVVRGVRDRFLQTQSDRKLASQKEIERQQAEQIAREKMLAEYEKTESQKIYERGEKRARELLENPPEENFTEENISEKVSEENFQTETENNSESQQDEKIDGNKPKIYREGNKFIVHVGDDVSRAKLALFGTLLKKYGGKYRKGTQTFEFTKASSAMSFATNVEITKMNDDERQKIYRAARVSDFPILKTIFDAGYNDPQARETLQFLQSLNDKQLAKFSIETMLNNYRGDSAKLEKARKYLSELRNGRSSPIGAYNKVYDILIGEETENGETLPALSAPKNISEVEDTLQENQARPFANISDKEVTPQKKQSDKKSEGGKDISAEEIENPSDSEEEKAFISKLYSDGRNVKHLSFDEFDKHLNDIEKFIAQTLSPLDNGAEINVYPQYNNSQWYRTSDSKSFWIYQNMNNYAVADSFTVHLGDFQVAEYETEPQAFDSLQKLRQAIERGDREFQFPNNEEISAETEKAAVVVTGDEFGEYADIKELCKKAIQYYKDHLQGTSVENKTLGKIDLDENGLVEFTGEGRRKVISNSAREDTLLLIKHLPQLIENAENISHKEAESEKHRAVGDSFYYLDTEYIKNNENIPLRVTLKKLHTGNIHYYNHVINPQNEKDVSVSSGTESSNAEANVSPTVNTSSTENITQNEESGKEKSDANEFFEEYLRENNLEENKNDLFVPSAQVTENNDGIPTIDKSFAENISQTADDGKENSKHKGKIPNEVTAKNFNTVRKILYDKLRSDKLPENKRHIDGLIRDFSSNNKYWKDRAKSYLNTYLKNNISEDDAYYLAATNILDEESIVSWLSDERKELQNLLKNYSRNSGKAGEIYDSAKKLIEKSNDPQNKIDDAIIEDARKITYSFYSKNVEKFQQGDKKTLELSERANDIIQMAKDRKISAESAKKQIQDILNDSQQTDETPTETKKAAEGKIQSEQDDEKISPKRDRIFATQEEANRDLREAFGFTEESNDEKIENKFVDFFDDSDENIERLKAKWKKEINKTSAMPMFNPELWTTALELGGIYIQRGINNFASWAKEMTNTLGKESNAWHGAIWETLKTMPDKGKFNDKQISAVANKIGGMYEDGITSLEEIQKDFEKVLSKERAAELAPIIKSTFAGIEKFFADNETKTIINESEKSDKENSDIQQNLFDEKSAVTEEKTDIEAEKFAPKNKYGIIFPEGNLKIRGRDAVKYFESFKGMTPSKATKFNESMDKVEKINGKDKTRREIIEGIGKGEIEESAIKLRKDEQEYLKFINEKLIEPLRAIKNAGLEKTRVNLPKLSETKYPYDFRGYSEFDFTKGGKHYIDFPELKDGYNELVQNTEALGAIEKLLKSLGGKLEKREKTSYSNEAKDFIKLNSYRVNFFDNQKGADTFGMSVNMLVQNEHLPYFEKSISDGEKPAGENNSEIEKRAREALKAAGLEGKTAPEGYIPTLSGYSTIDYRPNQLVIVEMEKNQKPSATVKKNVSLLAEKCKGEKFNPAGWGYIFTEENDGRSFFRALQIYFGNEGVIENERGELGESGSPAGGHQIRESELRETAVEGTRQEGNDKFSEEISGQQRQDEGATSANIVGTNAEDERPTGENSTGERSENDSARNGAGGSTRTVHAEGGDTERGHSGLSENAENVEFSGHNFKIEEDSGIGIGTPKEKFQQNLDAIKLLKQLENENRLATPSEQKILAKFNGWGSVAPAFSDDKNWTKENQQLKEILSDEEYRAANRAITNAFYTHPKIAEAMWKGLEQLGFKGGRILDPSMGSGIFFGTMPSEISARSELVGVELDDLTGRIAKQLYQKAAVDIIGFQKRKLPKNYFDLAISNVPFGSVKYQHEKQTYNIHNFFFAKAMEVVRPGGLVAFITSTGTMQSGQDAAVLRANLKGQADLIAAFKLPGNAFEKNAGTSVTTDVLILQKRLDPKKPSEYAQDWSEIGEIGVEEETSYGYKYTENYPLNKYYENHSENMLGTPIEDTLYGGRDRLGLDGKGRDVVKELSDLMSKLPKDIYKPIETRKHDTIKNTRQILVDRTLRDKTFIEKDGKIYQCRQFFDTEASEMELVEVPKTQQKRVKNFIALKKTVNNLLNAQLSPETTDEKLSELRQRLHTNYDNFVKNHGYINSEENLKILGVDPNFGMVAAIEKYNEDKKNKKVSASKVDIFYKRTVGAIKEPTSAENVNDALTASIAFRGGLDIGYMAKLLGKSEMETVKELGENVFENPATNLHELAEEYLSGNVREKLALAEEASRLNSKYKRNVEALRRVQPIDLTEKDIKAHIGAPWIDVKYLNDFIKHMLEEKQFPGYHIERNKVLGKWTVVKEKRSMREYFSERKALDNAENKNVIWGVEGEETFTEILDDMLNMRPLIIEKTETVVDSQGRTKKIKFTDPVATEAVKAKAKEIQVEFEKWLWTDEERKKDLLETFNNEFNNSVERKYDGSRLTFPGMTKTINLRPYQKDAIWRIMQGKNTLVAHCVGAGKTLEMIAASMEMKRLGTIRKPLFVLPNNILKQVEKEFLAAYPSAKLLVLQTRDLPGANINIDYTESFDTKKHKKTEDEEFTAKKSLNDDEVLLAEEESMKNEDDAGKTKRLAIRRAALSRIASEDWDAIIINHNLFKSLPMSPETYKDFYREMLEELEKSYEILKETGENKSTIKQVQTAIANLREKLERDTKEDEKEIVIPFEELGIDQIFVDEADKFKNLKIPSAMANISGLQKNGSQRSLDMYLKTKWLTKQRNGGGVVFATGTPISNSLSEIFTMQRYLDAETLEEKDWRFFDSWAAMFTKKDDVLELNPDGSGLRTQTYLTLQNLRTLSKTFRKFADIKLPEDLKDVLQRPKLKNDKRTIIEIEPTEEFKKFKLELVRRAEQARHNPPKKGMDNMLSVTNDFRKASIDLQMLDPEISEAEAGNKIPALCEEVAKRFKATTEIKGAQLIFSDLGTPQKKNKKGVTKKSVYDKIKAGLIKRGVPANQIAFVHDAKDADERQKLFEKVNDGDIRIIIGSTEMMGAGTNFQKHLVALHHVDCCWKPRDIEQREGRILRSGNLNAEVEILAYVTKDSYDSNMWEKVERKKAMIDSVMQGDPLVDEIVESGESMSFGELKAAAMGNPLLKERTELHNKITNLELLLRAHRNAQALNKLERDNLLKVIPTLKYQIENAKADIVERKDVKGENFKMKIGDKIFTKRDEAENFLKDTLKNFKGESGEKIGEIGGFDLKIHYEPTYVENSGAIQIVHENIELQLVNHGSYMIKTPTIKGIEAVLNNSPARRLNEDTLELSRAQDALKEREKNISKPFAQQAELDEIRRKFDEIEEKIKGEKSSEKNTSSEKIQTENISDRAEENFVEKTSEEKSPEEIQELTAENKSDEKSQSEGNEEKIQFALDKLKANHNFSDEQTKWIERFGKYVRNQGFINTSVFDDVGTAFQEKGGFKRINKIFDGNLSKIIDELNSYLEISTQENSSETSVQDKFEVGEFTHTKTGEKIPSAKLKDKVDRDEYLKLKALAKKHGGGYSLFSKRFLFDTAENRDKFIQESTQENNDEMKFSADFSVDNDAQNADNTENHLTDAQKTNLFKFVKNHIEQHIEDQLKKGVREPEILKELNSEHSSHRMWLLGKLRARLHDLEVRANDNEAKRLAVEKVYGNKNWNDEKITRSYDIMTNELREMINYGGLLYREIALHRAGRGGTSRTGFQLLSWRDAERQRNEREGYKFAERSEINLKHSGEGAFFDGKIKDFVEEKDLTQAQKDIADFGREMGTPIIFFKGDKKLNGAHGNGITYINVDSKITPEWIFSHESYHWLKKNNPALHREILKNVEITEEQRKIKRDERPDLKKNAEIDEEIIADAFSDTLKRAEILQQIGKKNKTLLEKIISWLKAALDKLTRFFSAKARKNFEAQKLKRKKQEIFTKNLSEKGLTREQKNKMYQTFANEISKYTDENGNKIFRVNKKTFEIQLANGEKLPSVELKTSSRVGQRNFKFADNLIDDEYFKLVDDYQNAKSDEESQAAYQKLQKLVQRTAEAAGFKDAVPEQTVAYKVRTKAAPKKTIKVYKVFTVANDGSPTALFIGGTEKLPQNVWLDAQDAWHFTAKNGSEYVPSTQNPYTKGGKTGESFEIPNEKIRQELIDRGFLKKGSTAKKITALAYRPGWHAGTLPFFPQGGTKRAGSNYGNIHRHNQVVFECELAAEKDYTAEAEAQPKARNKDGSLNSRKADLQYMPENGFYYYATNPKTHGHPELGMWVLSGSLKINRALTQAECDKILAENGKLPQEWEQGELNLADLGYTGEQYDAARKTLAPITFDDEGNIIPLSQRFDVTKNDIRYSFAGEKAKTANAETLKQAKKLERQGKTRDEIYDETGWFKGKDDKWRFEIPDNLNEIDFSPLINDIVGVSKLSRIYDNPALYAAYPKLEEVYVMFDSDKALGGALGEVDAGGDIVFNADKFDEEGAKSALVHEIQHIIQHYEKFAMGGSPETVKQQITHQLNKISAKVSKNPSEENYFTNLLRLKDPRWANDVEYAKKQIEKAKNSLTPKKFKEIAELSEKWTELKNNLNDDNISDFALYRRLGGEQESREVERRSINKMRGVPTPHNDDAIIVFGGKSFSMAMAQNSVDNENNLSDNDSEISQRFFGKYLGKGIMNMVQQTVEKEISEHVDISKTGDPVEHDKARDSLPYIKQMLEHYNILRGQKAKSEYLDRYAVKIEYARRCFENDERIRKESSRQVGNNSQQGRIFETQSGIISNGDTRGNGKAFREVNVGVFKNVSNELSGAY